MSFELAYPDLLAYRLLIPAPYPDAAAAHGSGSLKRWVSRGFDSREHVSPSRSSCLSSCLSWRLSMLIAEQGVPGGQTQHITISARDWRTCAFPRARQSDAAPPSDSPAALSARRYRWHEGCGPARCSFQITCCLSWYPPPTSTSPTAHPIASLIVLLTSVLIHAYLGTA